MMNKRAITVIVALTMSCLNFGDKKSVGAQPLEIQMAIHIPGPLTVIQKPLELSMDDRLAAQQIIWGCRTRLSLKELAHASRNTDDKSLQQNPLPEFSAILGDAYALLTQK